MGRQWFVDLGKLDPKTIAAVQALWASISEPVDTDDSQAPADTYSSGRARRLGRTSSVEVLKVDDIAISNEAQSIFRFVEQTWNMSVTHLRSKQKLASDEAKPLLIEFIEHALREGIKEGEIVVRHKAGFQRGRPPLTDDDMLNKAILTQAKRGYRFRGTPKKNVNPWPEFDGVELHNLFNRYDFRNSLALDHSDDPGLRIDPLIRVIVRQGMSLTLHKNDHLLDTRI